jgi:hypothetical protein
MAFEGATSGKEGLSPQELRRQQENFLKLEKWKRECDVRSGGAQWYWNQFTGSLDYGKIFNYLSTHFNLSTSSFRGEIVKVIPAQLNFQKNLATLEARLTSGVRMLNVPEEGMNALEKSYLTLKRKLEGYETKKRASVLNGHVPSWKAEQDERAARATEKVDVSATFQKVYQEARSKPDAPWPTDPDLLKERETTTTKSQPEHKAPKGAETTGKSEEKTEAAPEETTSPKDEETKKEEEPTADAADGGGAGDGGGSGEGGDGTEGTEDESGPEEPFVFDKELLKTPEGIARVRSEIERIADQVFKRRGEIGKKGLNVATEDPSDNFKLFFQRYRMLLAALDNLLKRNTDGSINVEADELELFSDNFKSLGEYLTRVEAIEIPEPKEESAEREPGFEFDPEMLETVIGRRKIFREMARMYSEVLHRRDLLGQDGKRHLKNEQFDGFDGVLRRFNKMKEFLRELSKRGVLYEDDKVVAFPIQTDISDVEKESFTEGYYALKSFYDRTSAFYDHLNPEPEVQPEPDATPEPSPEADSTAEPDPVTPDTDPEPEPTPGPAPKPDEEAEPTPGANPDTDPKADGEPEPDPAPKPGPTPPPKPGPTPPPGPEPTPAGPKAWEKRAELKRDMRAKKDAYEKDYEEYMRALTSERASRGILRRLQFWKEDVQPPELKAKEDEYLAASSVYAQMVQEGMEQSKFLKNTLKDEPAGVTDTTEKAELRGVRSWLAHQFVIAPAHEKLSIERRFVPDGAASRNLKSLQEIFKKHGKTISRVSLVTTIGISVVTGGVGALAAALTGKKLSGLSMAAGALIGGYLGNQGIKNAAGKRDASLENAFTGYKAGDIAALKRLYEENNRAFDRAVKNQKLWAVGGALTGMLVGGALSGQFETPDLEPPEDLIPIPPDEPVPPEEPETPEEPEKPDTPEDEPDPEPEKPDRPDEPDTKDPVDPEKPDEYKDPVTPDYPVTPDEPFTPEEPSDPDELIPDLPEFPFTFEPGDKIDTVSEALFETWKDNPDLVDGNLTKAEFLSQMYAAIAELEADSSLNKSVMVDMDITSGDIDKVQVGQTINLQPFFEYLNNRQ